MDSRKVPEHPHLVSGISHPIQLVVWWRYAALRSRSECSRYRQLRTYLKHENHSYLPQLWRARCQGNGQGRSRHGTRVSLVRRSHRWFRVSWHASEWVFHCSIRRGFRYRLQGQSSAIGTPPKSTYCKTVGPVVSPIGWEVRLEVARILRNAENEWNSGRRREFFRPSNRGRYRYWDRR